MADIQKLTYPYFTDGSTQLNAANLNPIIAKMNEVIDKVNGGVTPTQTVATPTISISGTTATITCSTSGATIRYAIDGTPTESSGTIIASGGTVDLSSYTNQKTIRAIAYKSGMTTSQVAQTTYTPSASYDSDAQAIMNRYTKSLSTAKKDAFNTFVVTLKNAGIFSNIDYLILPFLANDTTEAVQNALDGVAFLSNPSSLTLANNGIKPIVGEAVCKTGGIPIDVQNYHISFFNNDAQSLVSGKWDEAMSGATQMAGFGKGINAKGIGVSCNFTTAGNNKQWNPTGFDAFKETAKNHAIFTVNSSRMLLSVNGTQATKDDDTLVSASAIVYTFGQAAGISQETYRTVTSETGALGGGSFFTYGLLTIGKALTDAQCITFNTAVTTLMDVILA